MTAAVKLSDKSAAGPWADSHRKTCKAHSSVGLVCVGIDMKIPPAPDAAHFSLDGLDDDIFKGSRRVASAILAITQTLAFVPLFVIVVLQDVHLKMGVVLSTALCICLAVGNYWFHRMQVVKVYPKSLDTFLLLFYISLIPVVITHQAWLQYWVAPFHHGVVACFMWLSVLAPSWDNFTMQTLRDHLPQQLCKLPGTQRCALHRRRGASARDTAASQDGTAASRHQGWWQLRMPKKAARAAAEDEPAV
ncbi:hypothetical protein COO60DRAFT_1525692 [Scenedesmus sp. NREL 46B-D3]|nr:hypothetical protein COO60DRAFT_1525692 [Scenedesmus sp. NREL 46B-D3]